MKKSPTLMTMELMEKEWKQQERERIIEIINNLNIFPEGKGCQLLKLEKILTNTNANLEEEL